MLNLHYGSQTEERYSESGKFPKNSHRISYIIIKRVIKAGYTTDWAIETEKKEGRQNIWLGDCQQFFERWVNRTQPIRGHITMRERSRLVRHPVLPPELIFQQHGYQRIELSTCSRAASSMVIDTESCSVNWSSERFHGRNSYCNDIRVIEASRPVD